MKIDRRGFLALALGAAVAAAVPSVAAPTPKPELVGRIYFDITTNRFFISEGGSWRPVVDSDHAKAESWRRLRHSLELCEPVA